MIFRSERPDIALPNADLTSVVLSRAAELGDKIALIDGPSGRSLSFNELALQVKHFAAGLSQRGFKKGDVFAIFIPNLPEYAVAFLGVAAVGGINTTVNSLYSVDERDVPERPCGHGARVQRRERRRERLLRLRRKRR